MHAPAGTIDGSPRPASDVQVYAAHTTRDIYSKEHA